MTTIAYKDGIIAYDSRSTADALIINDDTNKKAICGNITIFWAGSKGEYDILLRVLDGSEEKILDDGVGLMVEDNKIYYGGMNRSQDRWKQKLDLDKPYAIGSGAEHAWTAMDMGATAKQAVKMAMLRNASTGGRIRTFRVPK